jgi:hypothetical protein
VILLAEKQKGRRQPQTEEAKVLSKKRCPHTGVVNFFTDADPLLAVGSVAEAGVSARFAWRCYIADEAGGLAPDISLAEAHLRQAIARRQGHAGHQAY